MAEDIVNLLSHGTRTVAEYMRKGFVFAMNIRKEMLRAFGKVDNGLQIDDFGRCFFDGRVQFCEIFQIIFSFSMRTSCLGCFFLFYNELPFGTTLFLLSIHRMRPLVEDIIAHIVRKKNPNRREQIPDPENHGQINPSQMENGSVL